MVLSKIITGGYSHGKDKDYNGYIFVMLSS